MAKTPLTHQLLHPIILEKKNASTGEIEEEELKPAGHTVVLRRPKAKDLRAFDRHEDAEISAMIDMIASCSNLDTIEAENVDSADFTALGNVLDPLGQSGPKTGDHA